MIRNVSQVLRRGIYNSRRSIAGKASPLFTADALKRPFDLFSKLAGIALILAILQQNEAETKAGLNIAAIKQDIMDAIDADSENRGDGTSMGPTLVRLAWHASGTYSSQDKTGGSNGATMRFHPEASWGANNGLKGARDFLEPIKKKYNISYADLWTLSGVAAIEQMGGPNIPWKSGRSDSSKPTTVPDGRLPGADKGNSKSTVAHVRDIFGRMGFTDREIVALLGAHALGRCHVEASGYWGPWTRAETTFSNEYFRLLIEEKWTKKNYS